MTAARPRHHPRRQRDDSILGGEGSDVSRGDSGDDSIDGGLGNDLLLGDAGNDTIAVRRGDTILGGTGDDSLTGGGGDDTFLFTGSSGNDTVTDFNVEDERDRSAMLESTITDYNDLDITDVGNDVTSPIPNWRNDHPQGRIGRRPVRRQLHTAGSAGRLRRHGE